MLKSFYEKFLLLLKRAISNGCENPTRLALAFSVGIYIAFSPFPGFHSVMIIAMRWLFGLNLPILFVSASINNPWTMIPFYSLDYAFGYWILHGVCGWESSWLISLEKFLGSGSICVWSFVLGGNLLGILAGVISFPISKKLITKFYENNSN